MLALALPILLQSPQPSSADANFGPKVRNLAERIVEGLNRADPGVLERALGCEEIARRAAAGLDLPAGFERGMVQGLKDAAGKPQSFAVALLQTMGENAHFQLRSFQGGPAPKALIRCAGTNGFNYLELEFAPGRLGQPQIVDVASFGMGTSMVENTRHLAVAMIDDRDRRVLGRLRGPSKDILDGIHALQEMNMHVLGGRGRQALRVYEALPEPVRNLRLVQVERLMAASQTNAAEHAAAFEDFCRRYPGDPTLDLLGIDVHLGAERWDEALGCLDRLARRVGQDAYLLFLRGNIQHSAGRAKAAVECWEKAVELEPTLAEPRWELLAFRIGQGDHSAAAHVLERLERDFDFLLEDLEISLCGFSGWEAFAASRPFLDWKRQVAVSAR
jgi:tetratricopeptide (TPR) repeat protein